MTLLDYLLSEYGDRLEKEAAAPNALKKAGLASFNKIREISRAVIADKAKQLIVRNDVAKPVKDVALSLSDDPKIQKAIMSKTWSIMGKPVNQPQHTANLVNLAEKGQLLNHSDDLVHLGGPSGKQLRALEKLMPKLRSSRSEIRGLNKEIADQKSMLDRLTEKLWGAKDTIKSQKQNISKLQEEVAGKQSIIDLLGKRLTSAQEQLALTEEAKNTALQRAVRNRNWGIGGSAGAGTGGVLAGLGLGKLFGKEDAA